MFSCITTILHKTYIRPIAMIKKILPGGNKIANRIHWSGNRATIIYWFISWLHYEKASHFWSSTYMIVYLVAVIWCVCIFRTAFLQNLDGGDKYQYEIINNKIQISIKSTHKIWRCQGSNPGPFTCKANALPLSYIPIYGLIIHIVYI